MKCSRFRLGGRFGVLLAAAWLFAPAAMAATTPIPADMGQRLAACISCHGPHGAGSPDDTHIPRLAGKPAGYLLQQMKNFHDGRRHYPMMEHMMSQIDTAYMRQIAEYFAKQSVPVYSHPVPNVPAAELARGKQLVEKGDASIGVPACEQCHGARLTGIEPMIPGLAGLSYDYIRTQLKQWRKHERNAQGTFCMGVVANRMQIGDIKAVAAYLAGMKAPANMKPQAAPTPGRPIPGWCVLGDAHKGGAS